MVLQASAGFITNGFMGLAGSRDDEVLTTGIGGRFERAYYNMLETFPVFAALVLIVHTTESWDTTSALAVLAGYVCAIKCGQLGLKTAIIEKSPTLGGTCLNVGCIPSKALLHASEMFAEASHGMAALGITQTVDGVAYLMKKNKVDVYHGTGSIAGQGKVTVTDDKGKTQDVATKNIVIATGSDVAGIPGLDVKIDEKTIVSSTGAIALSSVPKKMIVVGGGVIGLEMGSVWNRLGAEVTVVEYLDTILGGMDKDVSKKFQKMLAKQGMKFHLSSKVTGVDKKGKGASVSFEPVKGGDAQKLDADIVLVATDHWKTNVDGIWAIGDVTAGPMLAHKAEDEGVAVAETIAGQAGHVKL
ncbi:Dihydrolipoyl dehydrogenase [Nymphon striatum]|nr:Dihydrolipoyl dehydrogenase [Nymphon striatum]